jgi:hypothetical protein
MELRNTIEIDAPAPRVWETLGEQFMHIGAWASPITSSCPVGRAAPEVGSMRACTIAAFGPFNAGDIQEKLIAFDRDQMTFEYEAQKGLPRFVARAVNRWCVVRLDERRSLVRTHATLTLRGPAALLSCVLRVQMEASGARVLDELKHYVELGVPHPRKRAAASSAVPRAPHASG